MKKRALISVYDKDGLLDFAKFLISNNVEIISTGGTYKFLKENNIPVIEVASITNFPEMLDGRVKTLHPHIHAGILAIRDNKEHMERIQEHNIDAIDIVVVNLYPFFEKVKQNLSFEQKIEFIDIGGPTMLRAAAKNYKDVIVICDKTDYQLVINEFANGVTITTKKYLASKVFNLMSAYDGAISRFMSNGEFLPYFNISCYKKQDLRYGENPHQKACFYAETSVDGAMNTFVVLNGKELSYNNLKDVNIAWEAVSDFQEPACCALKHNTPCGFAIGKDSYDAYIKTYNADPISIFGGIVSFNRKVNKETAAELTKIFLEVIAAPEYDNNALEILKTKKNLRVIRFTHQPKNKLNFVSVDGGVLVQSNDSEFFQKIEVVTKRLPTEKEMKDLLFAMRVVKFVKSNAIVVANDGVASGIGGGQTNRIDPTIYALGKTKQATVLASDAFFPFRDVVDVAAKHNIKAIIQPGGSLKDQESIDACNEHNIAMVFTHMRHFKH